MHAAIPSVRSLDHARFKEIKSAESISYDKITGTARCQASAITIDTASYAFATSGTCFSRDIRGSHKSLSAEKPSQTMRSVVYPAYRRERHSNNRRNMQTLPPRGGKLYDPRFIFDNQFH